MTKTEALAFAETVIAQAQARPGRATDGLRCPACSSSSRRVAKTDHPGITRCQSCSAVFGHCYRGDAHRIAKIGLPMGTGEADHYFDLELLGSQGIERVHGWVDADRNVVQYG